MPRYRVEYAHDNDDADFIEAKYGIGVIGIETDEPVETAEQLKEIARTIGHQGGYTTVGITSITELTDEDEFDIVGSNDDRQAD